jgi:predicted phage terminase large subunit-like protein
MSDDATSWKSLINSASEQDLAAMEQQLASLSPLTFAQIASQGKWKPAKHLVYLDQAIQTAIAESNKGTQQILVVNMPPQHGKSEFCSKYLPSWYLGVYPDRRVILTSYEADFASSWGRKSRELLDQWGHLFNVKVSPTSSAASRWDLAGKEGGMTTAGVGGPITGKGAHLLIIDDPIKNDEEARSPTQREKIWQWWQAVASTRLRPNALVVLVQTRWHRDDLTGRVIAHANRHNLQYRVIKFPALAEAEDELGRQPGEALWPEMYNARRLEQIKEGRTAYYWQALYQQNPQGEGGSEWPDEYFGQHLWFEHWPEHSRVRVITLDPSKGTDAKFGDYSAFVKMVVGNDGMLFVDADLRRCPTSVLVQMAIEHQREFQADAFGIETNQFQQLLADEMISESRRQGMMLPSWSINNHVNKEVRIRRLTPWLSRNMIRFKAGSPGARLLVEQLRDFPHADHDDGPDALEMAIRLASLYLGEVRKAADEAEAARIEEHETRYEGWRPIIADWRLQRRLNGRR